MRCSSCAAQHSLASEIRLVQIFNLRPPTGLHTPYCSTWVVASTKGGAPVGNRCMHVPMYIAWAHAIYVGISKVLCPSILRRSKRQG